MTTTPGAPATPPLDHALAAMPVPPLDAELDESVRRAARAQLVADATPPRGVFAVAWARGVPVLLASAAAFHVVQAVVVIMRVWG